jgi:hypothetical protein
LNREHQVLNHVNQTTCSSCDVPTVLPPKYGEEFPIRSAPPAASCAWLRLG